MDLYTQFSCKSSTVSNCYYLESYIQMYFEAYATYMKDISTPVKVTRYLCKES